MSLANPWFFDIALVYHRSSSRAEVPNINRFNAFRMLMKSSIGDVRHQTTKSCGDCGNFFRFVCNALISMRLFRKF